MGYKPSVIEQAKFEYSPLGNIFNKGLQEEDKKEWLFKRLENIKDKNEELLNVFSGANKVSKPAKNDSGYNYDSENAFLKILQRLKSLKKRHWALNTMRWLTFTRF